MDIGAKVGELDALAAALGAALALEFAGEDLSTDDIDRVELGHQARVEEIVELLWRMRGRRR